jgi:hypothetical protein
MFPFFCGKGASQPFGLVPPVPHWDDQLISAEGWKGQGDGVYTLFFDFIENAELAFSLLIVA